MKILDCTLRDGGYYTNWDFDSKIVDVYIQAMNVLPIDYIELGYRSIPTKEYMGKFGYSPVSVLRHIKTTCIKKIAVMLNEKNTRPEDLDTLLVPIQGLVDMIRIAVDPNNFDRAVILAQSIKTLGFEVGFNTMYMSKWDDYEGFLSKLNKINKVADLFCMVDSFGGVSPEELKAIFQTVKQNTTCPVGFHGHNNLQLGLVNTLTAIECGIDYVDATILGMGRGAGNLNMELLLTYLNKGGLEVDFNVLGDVITAFQSLHDKYQWGTNLPYMLSGANSISQKK
ncbi:aldolase catalytic domain-containing protein [Bacteroides ovatus]|nr:aldolase catalytic domain-containing protein [Bacteroides ovatus]